MRALGAEGYGLWALCCSVNFFACFAQGVIAHSTQRFLSVAVGENRDVAGWYRVICRIHLVSALATVLLSAPIVFWMLSHALSVPPARLAECRGVMVFVYLLAFAAMVNTPNRQLFVAHQRMVEPALWGIASTLVALLTLGWMVAHPGAWLVPYAAVLAFAVLCSEGAMALRAPRGVRGERSPEPLRFGPRARQILSFAGWRFVSDGGQTTCSYGLTILVGGLFGAELTASAGLARSVATQVRSLSNALASAYEPALANAAGRGAGLQTLTLRAAIRQLIAYLVFAVPLFVFAQPILVFWLDAVPPQLAVGVRCLLVAGLFASVGAAFFNAVSARGDVGRLFVGYGLFQAAALPLAYVCSRAAFLGGGLASVFCGVTIAQVLSCAWCLACYFVTASNTGQTRQMPVEAH